MMVKTGHRKRIELHHWASSLTADSHAKALDARAKEGLREILAAEDRLHEWQQVGDLIAALQKWLEASECELVDRYRTRIVEAATAFLATHPKAHTHQRALAQMLGDVNWAEQWWCYEVGDDAARAAARRLFVSVVAWHLVGGGARPTDLARILRSFPTDSSMGHTPA